MRSKKRAEGAGNARPRARDNERTGFYKLKNGAKTRHFFSRFYTELVGDFAELVGDSVEFL